MLIRKLCQPIKLMGSYADILEDACQRPDRQVAAPMKRHGRRAPVGMAEEMMGTTDSRGDESGALQCAQESFAGHRRILPSKSALGSRERNRNRFQPSATDIAGRNHSALRPAFA